MAIQCATCGTQTRSGAKFCHACGTPIATTSLPSTLPLGATSSATETQAMPPPLVTPTAPQTRADTEGMNTSYFPQTPQTYHAPPPLAPAESSKKSGKTLKVVLISLAIIMALGIASIVGAIYFVSKKVSPAIAEMKRNGLPTFSTDPKSVPDEKLGVPIYPGAKREDTVSTEAGSISGAVVTFSTKDDVEEVADFYRDHFKEKPNLQFSEISDSNDDNGDVVFQVNGEGSPRLITISPGKRRAGRTEIVIMVGKGIPGIPGVPDPPPPPPPRGAMERKAQEIERRALEQAERALRDVERMQGAPPPPAPKH